MFNSTNRFLSALACTSACALASFATSAQAAPNLVQNGGFETNGGPGFIDMPPSEANANVLATTLANWVNPRDIPAGSWGFNIVTSLGWLQSQNYYYPGLWGATPGFQNGNGFTNSSNGGSFIASDGFDYRTPLQQTISGLEVNSEYTLSFEYAHAQEANITGDTWQYWQYSLGSDSFVTPTVNVPSTQFRGWYTATHTFTATSATEVLSFLAHGTNGLPPYLLLDGVSLTQTNPPGPAPSVPGPLPVVGAAGMLAWSRKLRLRMKSTGYRLSGSSGSTSAI